MRILLYNLSFFVWFFAAVSQSNTVVITSSKRAFKESAKSSHLEKVFRLEEIEFFEVDWKKLDPFTPGAIEPITKPDGLDEIWGRLKEADAQGKTLLFHLPDWSFKTPEGPGLLMREIISYFIGKAEVSDSDNHPWVAWGEKTNNTGWFAVHQSALTKGQIFNLFSDKTLTFKETVTEQEYNEAKQLLLNIKAGKNEPIAPDRLDFFLKQSSSGRSIKLTTTPVLNCLACFPSYLKSETLPKITVFHAGPTNHKRTDEDAVKGRGERHDLINQLDTLLMDQGIDLGHFVPEYLGIGTGKFDHIGDGKSYLDNPHPGITQVACEMKQQERSSIIYISLKVSLGDNIGVTLRNEIGGLLGRQMNSKNPTQPLVIFKPKEAHCMEAVELMLTDASLKNKVSYVNSTDGSFDLSKPIIVVEDENLVASTLASIVIHLNR